MATHSTAIVESRGAGAGLERRAPSGQEAMPEGPQRLRLSPIELHAVTRLVPDEATWVEEHVAGRATALASDEACRRRTLAKALAVADSQMSQFAAALADAVAKRDEGAARMLDQLLRGATKRVCMLSEELRADFSGARQAVLVVGTAEQVTVHGS